MPSFSDLIAGLLLLALSVHVTGTPDDELGRFEFCDISSPDDLEDITGAFAIEVTARFDSIAKGREWQRLFDFGNGPRQDNILMGQRSASNDMILEVWVDGKRHRATAYGAIEEGVKTTWRGGVTPDGILWIQKDGTLMALEMNQTVPLTVTRAHKLVGKSSWPGDSDLEGAVLGIAIINYDRKVNKCFLNKRKQIPGAFSVQAIARFDKLSGRMWQRIFDFGNGPRQDNILLGQCGYTSAMCFDVWREGKMYRAKASGAITEGETAVWWASVSETGEMLIHKNSQLVANNATVNGMPANVTRKYNRVGVSNWDHDMDLQGFVLGLRVYDFWDSRIPSSAPSSAPDINLLAES